MGVSQAYFVPSGMAVNQKVYLKECIQKRLIPFINNYHQDTQAVFWPDLASSHYATSVQDYLREQNVELVPRNENPANTPEARSIEDFWADLKRIVYNGDWQAKNITQLKQRIQYSLAKMDLIAVKARASETHARLDKIARKGL